MTALLRLQWSIQAIAQDAHVQRSLFPHFVCVADELALDFAEHHGAFEDSASAASLTPAQRESIRALDRALDAMSGPEHADLWTDEALDRAPEWTALRTLARTVLARMHWPTTAPPTDRAIYVGPPT
jgi:hypothetical protein